MNQDQAVAALQALTEVQSVEVARVGPTDVLVLECPGQLSQSAHARIKETLDSIWPGRKAVVLEHGAHFRIVREGDSHADGG